MSAKLFDSVERIDSSQCRHAEATFAFLNRVAGAYWDAVRAVTEWWYEDYTRDATPEQAAHLRERYRSSLPKQHHPAWWELYLHQFLVRLHPGASIAIEPEDGPDYR